MRLALCQIDTTVGDIEGNAARIRAAAARARERGAEVALFPELALVGYPPKDLIEREGFVRRAERALVALAAEVDGITCVVGSVGVNPSPDGRPAVNLAAVLGGGEVRSRHAKGLLPSYDVFDEDRYFEPGREVLLARIAERSVGITICEDIWSEALHGPRRRYHEDPLARIVQLGGEVVFNLSASPFHMGKDRLRLDVARRRAVAHGLPIAVVNLVGGNDELVFDGGSFVVDARGEVMARARSFEEDLVITDLASGTGERRDPPGSDVEAVYRALVLGLRDYGRKCGFEGAVIGLSGGIDSALTATVAADTFGPDRVCGVALPGPYSSDHAREDAEELAARLGIRFEVIPITPVYEVMRAGLTPLFAGRPFDATEENLQARIRGAVLMAISNKFGSLLLSTGNKSEVAVGYCTLYGDMAGGLTVLGDVPKTLVYDLARWVNRDGVRIPERSLSKAPSAELRPGQKDEDSLPPYPVLDAVLEGYLEAGLDVGELVGRGFDRALVERVVRMVERAEYKRRQAAPGLKVTSKAFGFGRRMPIARG